ncbi:hypothetical protein D3C76_487750 [compost metagenome]
MVFLHFIEKVPVDALRRRERVVLARMSLAAAEVLQEGQALAVITESSSQLAQQCRQRLEDFVPERWRPQYRLAGMRRVQATTLGQDKTTGQFQRGCGVACL